MTEESAVKVCIRVRPLIAREESAESEDAEPVHLFWKADKKSIHQIDDGNSTKSFSFDRVFTAEETTNQLYQNIAKPLVVSTVEGYNGTIFAYGQTSSGKTFTMMGSDRSPGVIPLAVEDVFQTIKNCPKKEFLLRVSYMEIYNETVTDLLVDSWKRKPLEVRETINKNIYVADLTEELVTSPAQALAWIRKGEKNRHYGKTKMNQRSSRSHTIFRMILESRERSDPASGENADGAIIVSHLNLVDLAGSERASQTGAEGTRFKEGCNINRSLFTLGQVIKKLTDESQKGFTNYRDSKLTRILQNSLGGNAKTVIIGTITPVALDETLSTLQFASTAKKMKNDPHVTEVSDDGALLKRYRNEIVDLKRRLHEVSSVTQTTATEKEVLSQLLQEKDQLQREQEDRIRNLTKLLVTSTNQVPAQKMPKRRVTWGGKMLRLARPSACDGGSSDLSFADPFTRKRKASNVSLMELVEDDEDFDSHWEIPDEPSDDMEISQSSVTVRSFGDSPKDFVSPDRMHELSGKVSSLQLQLQTEVQQKQEALEKVAMLDLRVADLERRLEEQNNTPSKTDEQMGKQFAEAIQLCETLASEKDVVEVERDYLKQELGMFLEQIETLEKEKAALSKEMEEKREMDEFKALEEEFRKEQEIQRLTEELESMRAERDGLLSGKEPSCQTSTEEMEKLLCRVTSLTEERDQLQEILEGLRQEKQQLKAELEDRMEMVAQVQCGFNQPEGLASELHQQDAQVTHLQQEIEQLQTTLQAVSEQKSQLEVDLQHNMEMAAETQSLLHSLQQELQEQNQRNADLERLSQERQAQLEQEVARTQSLLHSLEDEHQELKQNNSDHMKLCEQKESDLEQQIAQLNMSLQAVTEQKRQVEYDLQQNMNMASTTQELLKSVQEELCEQKQMNCDLEKLCQEKESSFDQQMRTLTEKLESTEAERDSLLSEKDASCQTSTEEMEKLLCRVTSLSEERDQLQEALEGLRREKQQLKAELEDRMEMISGIQERLSEQENLNSQQQPERGEQETKLQRRVQQLEEQLQTYRERHSHAEAEAETSQQLLSEAKTTISALKEQLSSLEQSTSRVKETASSRLQDSTGQLQESFRKFQHLIDTCSKYNSTALDKVQCSLKHPYLASLPKPTMNAYSTVCQLQVQTTQSLGNIMEHLQVRAQGYRNLFEELVKKDLAVFEERRLQDVLLCRAQAPCYSVRDEDFHTLWHHRLTELLNKRQLYLQKMASISSTLCANMASYPSELSAEIRHRERFKEQLQTLLNKQPFSLSGLDSILSSELDHRSAVAHNRKMILQGIIDEQNGLFEELKLLEAQADLQFREERSKSSTLLQALEGAPLKTELSLLKDNQQLVLQLQQTEEQVEALRVHNKQLEEAQIKANNRVSNHKQATQLLQTELQDTRAQVEDKDNAIQALRSKLRESEKNASPSAVELEKLRTKLFKMEVELSSASDNHKKEIQQMTTLMNQKEESLRKLKETLRKSQQEGEESFLQGEDLHARLTNPRGLVIKSSVVLEKTKLEEEVKQLQLKITELESLVSSQQVEINKWKSRAFKLKVKSKAEVDRPPSPCTPTKRGLPLTSDPSNFLSSPKKFLVTPRKVLDSPRKVLDSPRKLLDSPKVSVLDSPKSRFFDVGGSSEVLSRTCPKQFFDNSSLGTIPDAAAGADRKDWWPQSPKQEEMCKTQ